MAHGMGDHGIHKPISAVKLTEYKAEASVYRTEARTEPDNDRGNKNDGARLLDEGPASLPH